MSAPVRAVPNDLPLARPSAGERLRVAAVMDAAIVSGPGRQLAALAAPLRDAGVDLRVIVFQHAAREYSD